MEAPPLAKQSVSKLKALAAHKCVDIKACVEKSEIIAALKAGGCKDGDVAPDAPPQAMAPPPAKNADLDDGWSFSDGLLPDLGTSRPSKMPRTAGPPKAAAPPPHPDKAERDKKASSDDRGGAATDETIPKGQGLKFFNMNKEDKEKAAKAFAGRELPPQPPPSPSGHVPTSAPTDGPGPKVVAPPSKVVEPKPKGAEFASVPLKRLIALAEEHEIDLEGTLDKDDVIARLVRRNITNCSPKPKVVAPPPKKAGAAIWKDSEGNKTGPETATGEKANPKEYFAKRAAEAQARWRGYNDIFNNFVSKFKKGDLWEITKGFPLWAHEHSDMKCGWMAATSPTGFPTVIEIVMVGRQRLRVRQTRYEARSGAMIGMEPAGWMDVAAVTDDGGKLMIRPYDRHGMYVQTETGQEPILMRRTQLQEKLVIDADYGAGLHLRGTPAGMQVDDIDEKPGQPGLAVGDLIVGIGGCNLTGLGSTQAVEIAFRAAFKDGATLEIAA